MTNEFGHSTAWHFGCGSVGRLFQWDLGASAMTKADLDARLARRLQSRPLHRAAAEAKISADIARRGDEARSYRERMGYEI